MKDRNVIITPEDREYMRMAIDLSRQSVERGGGPFGAVVVKDGQVLASGANSVTLNNDPTAHAEVSAIREACSRAGNFKLEGAVLYSSCEPCPMCLSAAYWAGIEKLYYANTREDAAAAGFDDSFIYDQIPLAPEKRSLPTLPMTIMHPESIKVFQMWDEKEDKTEY